MSAEGPAQAGEVRRNANGDIEIFDGEFWVAVQSVFADADTGIRHDPPDRQEP